MGKYKSQIYNFILSRVKTLLLIISIGAYMACSQTFTLKKYEGPEKEQKSDLPFEELKESLEKNINKNEKNNQNDPKKWIQTQSDSQEKMQDFDKLENFFPTKFIFLQDPQFKPFLQNPNSDKSTLKLPNGLTVSTFTFGTNSIIKKLTIEAPFSSKFSFGTAFSEMSIGKNLSEYFSEDKTGAHLIRLLYNDYTVTETHFDCLQTNKCRIEKQGQQIVFILSPTFSLYINESTFSLEKVIISYPFESFPYQYSIDLFTNKFNSNGKSENLTLGITWEDFKKKTYLFSPQINTSTTVIYTVPPFNFFFKNNNNFNVSESKNIPWIGFEIDLFEIKTYPNNRISTLNPISGGFSPNSSSQDIFPIFLNQQNLRTLCTPRQEDDPSEIKEDHLLNTFNQCIQYIVNGFNSLQNLIDPKTTFTFYQFKPYSLVQNNNLIIYGNIIIKNLKTLEAKLLGIGLSNKGLSYFKMLLLSDSWDQKQINTIDLPINLDHTKKIHDLSIGQEIEISNIDVINSEAIFHIPSSTTESESGKSSEGNTIDLKGELSGGEYKYLPEEKKIWKARWGNLPLEVSFIPADLIEKNKPPKKWKIVEITIENYIGKITGFCKTKSEPNGFELTFQESFESIQHKIQVSNSKNKTSTCSVIYKNEGHTINRFIQFPHNGINLNMNRNRIESMTFYTSKGGDL